jgi:poly-beta-1,6-N-acetyl-D-glucosamine synthase
LNSGRHNYVLISPVRNEAKNITKTLESVLAQTFKPMKWVIVDDGSSDGTPDIVQECAKRHGWVELLKLSDRGFYDLAGGGEIKAFYRGFERIIGMPFDFLGKLDGDVSFGESYFESLFKEFDADPRLGIAGGGCYSYDSAGRLVLEKSHRLHVRGAARLYRRECWNDIGGVSDKLAWDAVDVYKARMLGWNTRTFNEIKMIHHVLTWTKGGLLRGRMRSGRIEYFMGTHPLYFLAKLAKEVARKPYFICCGMFAWGYLGPLLRDEERVVDDRLKAYIQREQLARLFGFGRT